MQGAKVAEVIVHGEYSTSAQRRQIKFSESLYTVCSMVYTNSVAKEYTIEEVQDKFLDHIHGLVRYWKDISTRPPEANISPARNADPVLHALSGLAFSILSMLDGCTNLPRFIVAPYPHPDDKAYLIDQGDDYYPDTPPCQTDIAGVLHEKWYKK